MFCVRVAGDEALTSNGSTWTTPTGIDVGPGLNAITSLSCPTVQFCASVDLDENAVLGEG